MLEERLNFSLDSSVLSTPSLALGQDACLEASHRAIAQRAKRNKGSFWACLEF